MTGESLPTPDLSTHAWARRERLLSAFEDGWHRGERPSIDAHLPEAGPDRLAVLIELVHIDLECRLKGGEAARAEDYLHRYPELAGDRDVVLALLAGEFELRRRKEPDLSVAEYVRRFPQYTSELEQGLPAGDNAPSTLRLGEARATPPGETPSTDTEVLPAPLPGSGLRYRPLRHHAKGGLGEVLVAEDLELNRQVALKRIQPRHQGLRESRRRFLLEAEITAHLEHPGVVPIHGLVHDTQGQPCYAMRFVRGETLYDAVQRFHRDDQPGRAPGERSLALRQLLGRFLSACNTLAYAHSQGVIHRDVKPQNIMLGPYGETLVVDWGLARVGVRDQGPGVSEAVPTLAPASLTAEGGTRLGEVLGTPSYMSPEQAAGRWNDVGPSSDIYSLGATLYVLLTGQPPYPDKSWAELRPLVLRGEFPPPRQLKKDVPPALAAICQKAMALKPEHRYATALELAADVERWLADEPVAAYEEPFAARVGRWARRHRQLTTAVGVLLVASVVGLALGLAVVTEEKEKTAAARDEARQSFHKLHRAVDQYLTRVSESTLLNVPGLQPLRKELLQLAFNYYQDFLRDRSEDPLLQTEVAAAHFRIAQINAEIAPHEYFGIAGPFQQGLEILQKQLQNNVDVAQSPGLLSGIYKGRLRLTIAQVDSPFPKLPVEAVGYLDQALLVWGQLARENPHVPGFRNDLAGIHHIKGLVLSGNGQDEEARKSFEEAKRIWEQLLAEDPGNSNYQSELAVIHGKHADTWRRLGDLSRAMDEQRQVHALAKQMVEKNPGSLALRYDLASTEYWLGQFHSARGDRARALESFRESHRLLDELVSVTSFQRDLAMVLTAIGLWHAERGELPEALEQYRQAEECCRRLLKGSPGDWIDQTILAEVLSRKAQANQAQGESKAAAVAYGEAAEHLKHVLDKSPPGLPRRLLGMTPHGLLTHWLLSAGQVDRAVAVTLERFPKQESDFAEFFEIACDLAACSRFLSGQKASDTAAKAVEVLKQIDKGGGFQDKGLRQSLGSDTRLEPLRSRKDFQELLAIYSGK